MKRWQDLAPRNRRLAISATVLAIGWSVGLAVYLFAPPDEGNPLADVEQSKVYLAQLERIGGKSAVISKQLSDAFAGLWQGAEFGITIAVIALIGAALYLLIASVAHANRS
jgi:hypothetical protein